MESIKQLAQRALRERINGAESVKTPTGYTANYPINRMQRDYTNMLGRKHVWCNWSSPGAGKTNSALVAGRTYNCRNMVIICPNSVKNTTWVNAINEVFKVNSRIINITNIEDIEVFDRKVFNYIIINYDKFSISSRNGGKNMVDALLDNNDIDFICFDEAHCVKKTGGNMTKRRQVIEYLRTKWEAMNPDKYICGMTATPTTTAISEARSMIELVTGKKYDDIKDDRGIINILQCHKGLINNGTRYKFDPGIKVENTPIYIDGSSILNEIRACRKNKSNVMEVEKLLTELKMNDPNVLKEIKRDTIIFSYYCDNNNNGAILNIIKDKVAELGFTYAVFSGGNSDKREQGLKEFIKGEKDILIATQPIVSGIDGLQKRSNRMLMIGYPWTNEKFEQLSGRIVRQRSNFNIVHIINTIVNIKMKNGKNWSWDLYKINKIQERRNLQDMLLDGKFHHIGETKGGNESEHEMANKLLDRLEKGMTASDYTPNREDL